MTAITPTQKLKIFIVISSLFAFFCRFLNTGFGLVIFFPIYLFLVIFHLITLSVSFQKIAHSNLLKRCAVASQLCFVCFFLLSTDVGDSTGGVTIFVALEQLGLKGITAPAINNQFLVLNLALAVAIVLLDIAIIVISGRANTQKG